VITLAPTVTLWDAGEFITAAKVLGVPHPPGTPLFVMLGHVWGEILPLGGYAWRLNLMSACFSAAGAGCLFLVAHRLLSGEVPWLRMGGAAAAALFSAFSFTNWQNSNETEVYTVATFSIAAICWLCLRWRDVRGTPEAPHLQLLIVYVAALSIGNHLLALLVGPAVSLFIVHTLRAQPAADPAEQRMEWAEWSALTALWIVLIAVGLGSTPLLVVGGVLVLAALVACVLQGSVAFPLLAIGVAAIGISTYAFLYIRSGLQPLLDEANPENWTNLLAVIRREQFGSRGLLDNPTVLPGPDNPGRTLTMFGYQFVNYFQYCSWQWGGGRTLPLPATAVLVLVFTLLGVLGFDSARQRDVGIAQLLLALWLITGVGLVLYMNFKPGFSLFWDRFTTMDQHEVRERDYFFVGSFQMWGVFAGIGLARVLRLVARDRPPPRWALVLGVAFTLVPFATNFTGASRRHGPDAYAARDFAYNLLQSVEPYGVLFGFGDNDTFPVWYLQEVEGIRQDVTQINLSLANLDWYVEQLAYRPTRPFNPQVAPRIYWNLAPPEPPTGPALPLTPADIAGMQPLPIREDGVFHLGPLELPIRKGMFLRTADQVILYTLATYLPKNRPVTFGVSSGRGSWLGLDPHLVFRGLVFKVVPRADTTRSWLSGVQGTMVDSATTRRLVDSVFEYGKFFVVDSLVLEPAAQQVARSFSIPFIELGNAAALRGDARETAARFRRAHHLNPTPALEELIRRIETEGVQSLFRR
jgi:transmembrane protein TMEM260 (protein O-mannosyltransferase)